MIPNQYSISQLSNEFPILENETAPLDFSLYQYIFDLYIENHHQNVL
ncbi:hypothetical protein NW072_05605 [Mycoplasmopsis felis]|nr:hypothetical protein [Mycoplasmopsis felis]UWV79467.1 hypothetical protein NW072_05605 [Mycoplasmopsis felis]